NNLEPRVGFAYSPDADGGWLRRLTGGPDRSSIRGGFGLYDGRIFQSVFSQSGANVRFNPPNAAFRTFDTLPGILNVADPTPGFPDLRGKKIDRIAADVLCAGTGFIPGVNPTAQCPNPVPIADNEISFRVPRTNERRPDPRYTTNLLISNDAQAWYDGLQLEW